MFDNWLKDVIVTIFTTIDTLFDTPFHIDGMLLEFSYRDLFLSCLTIWAMFVIVRSFFK